MLNKLGVVANDYSYTIPVGTHNYNSFSQSLHDVYYIKCILL